MQKIQAGVGRISLESHGSEAVFSELSYTYPLKLLSPRLTEKNVAAVYILSYGGGLVSGDRFNISVDVRDGSILVMLSQGFTKVFKTRYGLRPSSKSQGPSIDDVTCQELNVEVSSGSALFLLPDPVTCFRAAKYNQLQTFRLSGSASAVLLDWVTSGRKSLGEEWVFSRYYSLNEVWVDGKRVARDAMLLEEQNDAIKLLPPRTLADRLSPYSCYATVLMYGPLVEHSMRHLNQEYEAITVFKHAERPTLIWSLSTICEGKGCIVRVAAKETEDVRNWLGMSLHHLEGVIGIDTYRKAFG